MVKEKFKLLKKDIKKWSVEKFGGHQAIVEALVCDINLLNAKEELWGA